MLKAFLISIIAHFSIVYFIPSVQYSPPDTPYIEVDRIQLGPEEGVGRNGIEDTGTLQRKESIQERPELGVIPTHLDAVEPESIERSPETVEQDSVFVGVESKLPENIQTFMPANQLKKDTLQMESIPPDLAKAQTFSPQEIPKQVPDAEVSVSSQTVPAIQPREDVLLTAEQPEKSIPAQVVQEVAEDLSPGFTIIQASELIDHPSEKGIPLRQSERTFSTRPLAVTSKRAIPLAEKDQSKIPAVNLPDTQGLPDQLEPDVVFTAHNPIVSPAIAAANIPSIPSEEQIAFPAIQPVVTPLEENPPSSDIFQMRTFRSSATLSSQEIRSVPTISAPVSEAKIAPVEPVQVTEKQTVPTEETLVKAMEPALPHTRPILESLSQSPPDELRSISAPRASQPEREVQSRVALNPQAQPVQEKQSFVAGGTAAYLVPASNRSGIGIVVPKDITVPQAEESEIPLQQDDTTQRIEPNPNKEEAMALKIEGPASTRKVISKPARLPDVQLEMAVTIRLKFWVLPDGTIGDVIPLQRGDVRLERAAIQYLKSWRFTPISPNSPKVWGIVPITYKFR